MMPPTCATRIGHACPTASVGKTACQPGSVAEGGSASCRPCPAGRYQNASASSSCVPCATGALCPTGATMELTPSCSAGTFGDMTDTTGTPYCITCPPGHHCLGSGVPPIACPRGSWAGSGAATCTDCTSRSFKHTTTLEVASRVEADCCCAEGYYEQLAPGSGRACTPCDDK